MALWISKLMNTLCRPLVRRIGAELLPHIRQELAEMRRASESAILPLVLKNEIEHMQQLPLAFLREQKQLVFVGYCSSELSGIIDGSRCLLPPIKSESELASNCLTFLDEYHFIRLIRELPTLLVPVHSSVVLPFRGDYLPEGRIRQILHQLGFPEVLMLTYERLSESASISGVSNPMPVSSLPIMLNPVVEPDMATRWLVANRYPTQQ
ncbi:hypothetical protein [Ferribacterium limneticum]|uniref:hypothetical protein n=1 Tax=Ferribacterium limneticum TaxID=76259 RepID=UPI001CF99F95|nr:hypothetical protein [Ferribacterium limneticum]UCV29295.1 hypothetical protein KI617_04115 [Ferribacterium limneticum]UCV33214.1 hypothetical protein KI608_04115 [Ferribacterium limneticum]